MDTRCEYTPLDDVMYSQHDHDRTSDVVVPRNAMQIRDLPYRTPRKRAARKPVQKSSAPLNTGSPDSAQRKRSRKGRDYARVEHEVPQEPRSKKSKKSQDIHEDGYCYVQSSSELIDTTTARLEQGFCQGVDILHTQGHDPPPALSPSRTSTDISNGGSRQASPTTLAGSTSVSTTASQGIAGENASASAIAMRGQLSVGRITNEQLIREIKSIYSALVLVEAKAIQVDRAQAAAIKAFERGELAQLDDHWKELVGLHRSLLHEHNDFFLASQHVEASLPLKELAVKYSMPARLWKHGIHSFLELLRYRLPDSREYMTAFIYFAYQMMTLLYETVPTFALIWMECAGDLSRYRMAIETDDKQDRDVWAATARDWYARTAERSPGVGRLYHHLAILARPFVLRQIHLYSRALVSVTPFISARESMTSILEPMRPKFDKDSGEALDVEMKLARLQDIFLNGQFLGDFKLHSEDFVQSLPAYIETSGMRYREDGAHIAISLIAAVFEHGAETSVVRILLDKASTCEDDSASSNESEDRDLMMSERTRTDYRGSCDHVTPALLACELFNKVAKAVLQSSGKDNENVNLNVLPQVHIILVFLSSLAPLLPQSSHGVIQCLFAKFPWTELRRFLDVLLQNSLLDEEILGSGDMFTCERASNILPEDHLLRGLVFAVQYLPEDWFNFANCSEERTVESQEVMQQRIERVLRLGCKLTPTMEKFLLKSVAEHTQASTPMIPDLACELHRITRTRFYVSTEHMLLEHCEVLIWYSGTMTVVIPSTVVRAVRNLQSSDDNPKKAQATKVLELITWARNDQHKKLEVWTACGGMTAEILEEPIDCIAAEETKDDEQDFECAKIERRLTELTISEPDSDDEDERLFREARKMSHEQMSKSKCPMATFFSILPWTTNGPKGPKDSSANADDNSLPSSHDTEAEMAEQ